jgi:TP901 family phage tail tape measure protein
LNIFNVWGEISLRGAEQVRAMLGGIDRVAQATGKAMAQTGQRFVNTGQAFVGAGQKMTATGGTLTASVTAPIVGMGWKAITAGMDFANAMSKVQAVSGATGEDLAALEAEAKKMGRETSFSATQAADAFGFMALAGWNAGQMLDAINPVLSLAKAGSLDLGRAADIVTDTMGQFGMAAEQASYATDMFAYAQSSANTNVDQLGEAMKYAGTMANSASMSMGEATSVLMAFANQGVKGSDAGTTFNAVLRDMRSRAEDGMMSINGMNISLYDQQGNFRGLVPIMKEVETATQGLNDAEKDAALSKYFQVEAIRGVSMMLTEGMDKIDGYRMNLEKAGGATKDITNLAQQHAKIMGENSKGAYDELLSKIEAVSIAFAQVMEPAVFWVTAKLGDLATWLENTDQNTKMLILGTAAFAAALGPVILYLGLLAASFGHLLTAGGKMLLFFTQVNGETGLTKFGSLLNGLRKAFTAAIWGIRAFSTALFTTPIGWIILGITAVIAAIYLLWTNWDTVSGWLTVAWEWLKSLAMAIFEPIANFISETWEKIKTRTMEIWNAVKAFLAEWGTTLLAILGGPIGILLAIIIEHWDKIKSVTMSVWNAVKYFLGSVWNAIKAVMMPPIQAIASFIMQYWRQIKGNTIAVWNVIKAILARAWEAIKAVIMPVIRAIANNIRANFNIIRTVISTVMNVVRNLIRVGWNNIKTIFTTALNLVKDTVKTGMHAVRALIRGDIGKAVDIVNGFKSRFLTAGKGLLESLTKGIRNGISKAVGAVQEGMEKIRSFLPFSPAKEGPLSDLDKSGQAFFPTWVSRMLSQKGLGKGLATIHKGMGNIRNVLETGTNPNLEPIWAASRTFPKSIGGNTKIQSTPTNVYITVHGNLDSELYNRLMHQQAQDTKNAFYIRGLRG